MYNDTELIKLNIDELCTRSFEAFCINSDAIIHRIIRSIVDKDIDSCEISDCELIDIHRDLSDIYDKEVVKSTEQVKLIRNAVSNESKPVVVFGDSSSGKTISVAQALDHIIASSNTSYTWIDLSDVNI